MPWLQAGSVKVRSINPQSLLFNLKCYYFLLIKQNTLSANFLPVLLSSHQPNFAGLSIEGWVSTGWNEHNTVDFSAIIDKRVLHKSLDIIPTIFLKKYATELDSSLSRFYNNWLTATCISDFWKCSSLDSVFKNTSEILILRLLVYFLSLQSKRCSNQLRIS